MKYIKTFENYQEQSWSWQKNKGETIEWIKDRFRSDLSDDKLFYLSFDESRGKKYMTLTIPVNARLGRAEDMRVIGPDGEITVPRVEPDNPIYYSDGQMASKNALGKYVPEENRDFGFDFSQVSDFVYSVKSYLESTGKYKGLNIWPNEAKQKMKFNYIDIDLDNPSDLEKLESTRIGNLNIFYTDSDEEIEDNYWYDEEDDDGFN